MKYEYRALMLAEMSTVKNHQHGAICVIGGKIVSEGYNINTHPHLIKVGENVCKLRAFYTC